MLVFLSFPAMLTNGPDKAGELTRHRCDRDGRSFPAAGHPTVASMQPLIGFLGDGNEFCSLAVASFANGRTGSRGVAIMPCRLHQNMTNVRIAGFCDAEAARLVTRAVLARHQANRGHQLSR